MSPSPNSLTALELDLIEKSESALRDGKQLLNWWRERSSSNKIIGFPLRAETPSASMTGFFDQLAINGKLTSVMGCLQRVRVRQSKAADRASFQCALDSFSRRELFRFCRWQNPDGLPGGFGYAPLLCREKAGGVYTRFAAGSGSSDIDLSEVGKRLEWILLQVDLFDFARCFRPPKPMIKPLSRIIKEAAYLVADEDLLQNNLPASAGSLIERGLGYSFVPATVHPNFFGFGPGRFGAALKLFQFRLLEGGELEIECAFLAAPRSQKVLYLGGFDPVYGLFHLANALTLSKFRIKERIHDKLDTVMLRQHGDVHQSFLEGLCREIKRQNCVLIKDGN